MDQSIFIKTKDEFLKKVDLDLVYFFTKFGRKVIIYYSNRTDEMNTTLYHIYELLKNNKNFLRSHKSYIININFIDKISKYTNKTYNVQFKGTKYQAFITSNSLKLLSEKIKII